MLSFSNEFKLPQEIFFYRNSQQPGNSQSLTNNNIFYTCTSSRGQTFVLAHNGGINRLISGNLLSDTLKFDSFTKRDGLLSDLSLSMIEDRKQNLWFLTTHSISLFYPELYKIDDYSSFLQQRQITLTEASPVLSATGNIILGSDKGILVFNPYEKNTSPFVPPIVLTRLVLQGEPVSGGVEMLNPIVLTPGQRNISIQFAALDYRNPQDIKYAYKIEEVDKDWNYNGSERTASYLNLTSGTYHFQVKSTNSDGIWVDNNRIITLEVKPRFWETPLSRILILITAMGVLLLIFYVWFSIFRLRHAVKMEKKIADIKMNFFTEVSHELRTPLTLITSPLNEVLEDKSLSGTSKKYLTLVKKNSDRMLRMVNQILDFRKAASRKMKLVLERTEIVSFIKSVLDSFHYLSIEKNIHLSIEISNPEIVLFVDRDKFEKIIFNLLSNAFKYTPSNKSIRIKVEENNEKVFISVSDQGIGIDQASIDSLFQQYETLIQKYNVSNSTGIGLSLVKELVALHHGDIEVDSKPGIGSTFKIVFFKGSNHFKKDEKAYFLENEIKPDCKKPEESHFEEYKEEKVVSNKQWQVLIVEDNTELRSFITSSLSSEFRVAEAENGKDGFDKTLSLLPDIIVTDVMMPVMDGLDMIIAIKENPGTCHIPIIILSAKDTLDDRILGLERGIDDYLTKPFQPRYLKTRIHGLIEQRRILQEYYLKTVAENNFSTVTQNVIDSYKNIASKDDVFIHKLTEFMETQLENPSLTVDDLVDEFNMSRAVFFRKMKILLGLSPVAFIQQIRVNRAVHLFDSGIASVADVAYRCGFNDPNYFSRCFKKQLGITPSEYLQIK